LGVRAGDESIGKFARASRSVMSTNSPRRVSTWSRCSARWRCGRSATCVASRRIRSSPHCSAA